jgi:RHS repeat-associated protein
VTVSGGHIDVVGYGYDINGDQTRAGNDTFDYNLDHSLAKATVGGKVTTFGYDAKGLRLSATTTDGGQATTQHWSWDLNGTLPQIALDTVTGAGGQLLDKRGFTYGPDDEPLALLDPGSGAHAYTHDWLGGVADMLSPGGQPEKAYDYDPYGVPRVGDTLKNQPGGAPDTGPANPLQYTGAYQDSSSGKGNYYLRARNYNPGTGRFTATDPVAQSGAAISPYAYAENNPVALTDPTGTDPHDLTGGQAPDTPPSTTTDPGPSPEDMAKAQQLQSKSMLDVVLEAGASILLEILGINDIINCLHGDIGACVMMVVGNLPWGKIFKAKKIAEALWKAGKAIIKFIEEIKWAKAILRGAEKAAEAAKAAAAAAAKAAAEKAAKIKAAAEAAAKKAADEAAARAKALAAKAKAATKRGAAKAEDAAESCVKHSFVAGIAVLLANGTSKPIDQTRPGDTVLATDPLTGKTEARQVVRAIRTDYDTHFVDLTVRSPGAGHTITTTEHHPFWSVGRGRWVDAGDLRPGELLRTSAGTYLQLGAVRRYQAQQRTYDLTVDGVHTYYVLAAGAPILVHNVNPAQCELLFPGPNAGNGVPASTFGDVTTAERGAVQQEGDLLGCHSCGRPTPGRPSGLWTPDHQPITSLVPEGTPQLLFPHCATCMARQGNLATKLLTGASPSGWRPNALGLVVPRSLAESGWVQTASGLLVPG